MCAKLRTLPSSIFLGGSVLVGMALSSATNLCGILSVAALYFVVNHHCGRANPSGYTMTPPTIPIILRIPRIPIIPRLASPSSTCVPQWASRNFFGGSVLVGMALSSATNLCGSFVSGGLYFVVNHHCGEANPRGYTMTPPTIPIILRIPIIPIIPRQASPISACVPQWSSKKFHNIYKIPLESMFLW